jgi:hypothetical protein
MRITRKEWKELFALRDELEDPDDRALLRRFINYLEHLEKTMRSAAKQLHVDRDTGEQA